MIDILSLPSSVATNEQIPVPSVLAGAVSIEIKDEQKVYKDLSRQLRTLETTVDYSLKVAGEIEAKAKQMMIAIDEKQELLMRCKWLVIMSEVKNEMNKIASLEDVKSVRAKLSRVQTCPLKKQLMKQLEQKEANLEPMEVVLSSKDALVEAIFETGNKTFINLGIAGREYVLEGVIANGKGTIDEAIAKAEALEARVEALKQIRIKDEFIAALESLPLAKYNSIPSDYFYEVIQKLSDNPNWNGLFSLDRMIQQYIVQCEHKMKSTYEITPGVQTTIVVNEETMKQFGVLA